MTTPVAGVSYYYDPAALAFVAPGRESLLIGPAGWVAPPAITAGSLPVGSASYGVPDTGQVLFVSPSGSDAAAGTVSAPKATLAGAIAAASTSFGDTPVIVMRAGTYHESITITKRLTIQAYPGEAVWLDGSTVYSSWTGSGPWTAPLGPNWDPIDSSRYPYNDPAANLPEQVWVDGVALSQIADGGAPAVGQFSVNRTSNTITIGTNPAGKSVRVADLNHALVFAARCSVYGIGFRRCSPLEVEGISALVYFGGTAQGSILENCVFQESGMHGISTARQITLRNITVQDCNQSGIQATTANGIRIERFVVRRCNRGLWKFQPITAGIKITKTDQSLVMHGRIYDVPNGAGLWWDTYCPRLTAVGVYVDGATAVPGGAQMDVGIHPEGVDGGKFNGVQYTGWIVNCHTKNTRNGVKILDAGWITVANSKVELYSLCGFYLQQDDRRNDGSKADEGTVEQSPWLTLNNSLLNNDIGQGGLQVIAYQDPVNWTPAQLGWDAFLKIEGNWFRPAPPGSMVQLGRADGTRASYNTLAALAASPTTVGVRGSKLGVNHQGTTAPSDSIAVELPEDIAALLGIPRGLQRVGPFLPDPVDSF